jgi:hypothetical protein
VTLSIPARRAIDAAETGEVFLLLLTIAHRLLVPPIRFVNNTTDITSRGNAYKGCPFQITLPDERDDQVSASMQIQIDNVDRKIMEGIRLLPIGEPPTVTAELILASSPDLVEQDFPDFTMRKVEYDVLVVTGTLMVEDMLNEKYPQFEFTPRWFPALFASKTRTA